MRKPKILMLGWEFPPIINGGLGIACLGLCKALRKSADISLILPKADPSYIVDHVELIGLNNIDLLKLKDIKTGKYYKEFTDVEYVEANLLPYEAVEGNGKEYNILKEQTARLSSIRKIHGAFEMDDLYGDDLIAKVIEFSRHATNIAATKEFDIIHCHDWMTFLAGLAIKEFSKKPLVLHVHSLEYDRGGPESQGWVYDLEKYGMENADVVVPVSQYTGSIAKNHYGINPKKIFPVHNGADPVNVYHTPKDFPEKLILFLGRITEQKGPQYFLDIASKVIESVPNVRFVMAGTGDRLRGLIETGAYKQIGNKFHFTGFLSKDKVHKLLSIADVYCMPSVSEPFGLSALEAAQFGIPCVISNQSGVAEVLFGALKADYWDVDKMAGHIISLLQNESLRETVVRDAFNDLQTCTWTRSAERVMSIYRRIA